MGGPPTLKKGSKTTPLRATGRILGGTTGPTDGVPRHGRWNTRFRTPFFRCFRDERRGASAGRAPALRDAVAPVGTHDVTGTPQTSVRARFPYRGGDSADRIACSVGACAGPSRPWARHVTRGGQARVGGPPGAGLLPVGEQLGPTAPWGQRGSWGSPPALIERIPDTGLSDERPCRHFPEFAGLHVPERALAAPAPAANPREPACRAGQARRAGSRPRRSRRPSRR
jgi:hypothetical protein